MTDALPCHAMPCNAISLPHDHPVLPLNATPQGTVVMRIPNPRKPPLLTMRLFRNVIVIAVVFLSSPPKKKRVQETTPSYRCQDRISPNPSSPLLYSFFPQLEQEEKNANQNRNKNDKAHMTRHSFSFPPPPAAPPPPALVVAPPSSLALAAPLLIGIPASPEAAARMIANRCFAVALP